MHAELPADDQPSGPLNAAQVGASWDDFSGPLTAQGARDAQLLRQQRGIPVFTRMQGLPSRVAAEHAPGLDAALALEYAPSWQACLGMHSAIRRAAEEPA